MHLESDLNIASFLLAKGFGFVGLELLGTRYAFKFEDSEGNIIRATQDYNRGALVPAREFASSIQQLKGALYAAKFKDGNRNGTEQRHRRSSHPEY